VQPLVHARHKSRVTRSEDFLKNPPGPGQSPQVRLMNALIDFDKPLIAAVRGAALGGDHAHATANSGTLPDVRFGSLADNCRRTSECPLYP
jgi:hypothetical protein